MSKKPLAESLRPQSLDDFVGQSHIKQRIQAIMAAERLPSLLFFGPPGCGKSTLALLLAQHTGQAFARFSAPETGVAALRKQIANLDIVVLDELHRYSKAQQDFFLPLLESGDITLLATTTENPSFSVTNQLLSRLHVLRLRELNLAEMVTIAQKGAAHMHAYIPGESLDLLGRQAGGDARTLLNLVEYTSKLEENDREPHKLNAALPEIVARGDRNGDNHYELISALIKSIRGSDPDASLYYLACLLESGEDPKFITRRLILSASEDVGLADPQALPLAVACQQAIEGIGMPEGFIPLAETTIYLALAPKSNSAYAGYLAAKQEIRRNGPKPVPLHLRNASTKLQKEWGYGKGYQYPHSYPDSWISQEYLPDQVSVRHFYQPNNQGAEPKLQAWLQARKRGSSSPTTNKDT
ncbi:MAG: recombinase RarA [Deltaproteobacteria bacterium]|nr:MAG: recombinase RarA [Deltaproteobacteria bacterium]